jgi:ectoine hydroxylase-related dioxygenase (phytanoyl-CoA dioxygenase family)
MDYLNDCNTLQTSFERDGYCFPLPALNQQEAGALRAALEEAERVFPIELNGMEIFQTYSHLVVPAISQLAKDPRITDPVASLLGPNLLLLHTSIFIKEPMSTKFVSWHQDLTYWGLDQTDEVTAWLAVTPATTDNGCMRFVTSSHTAWAPHEDRYHPDNMLSRSQEITVPVDESDVIDVTLKPGEISLHHGRIIHASGPNYSEDRRIGIALRYIPPSLRQINIENATAMLCRGEDNYDHFELIEPPASLFAINDIARLKKTYATENWKYYQGAAYEN